MPADQTSPFIRFIGDYGGMIIVGVVLATWAYEEIAIDTPAKEATDQAAKAVCASFQGSKSYKLSKNIDGTITLKASCNDGTFIMSTSRY